MYQRAYSLAIHPVGHSSVTRDTVAKVLDVEGPLEAAGKETAERRDQRSKGGHDERVQLERRVVHRGHRPVKLQIGIERKPRRRATLRVTSAHRLLHEELELMRPMDGPPKEHRVGLAVDVGQNADSEVLSRADHVLELLEEGAPLRCRMEVVSLCPGTMDLPTHRQAEQQSAYEGADKAFHRLLRAELDQRRLTKQFACTQAIQKAIKELGPHNTYRRCRP